MPTDSLTRLLAFNAAYTAMCGVISLAGASTLAEPFGLKDAMPLQAVGAFLIVVAAAMVLAARLVPRTRIPAALLTVGDVGYIAASIGAVALGPLSALGKGVTLAVAALVAVFVMMQAKALMSADRQT